MRGVCAVCDGHFWQFEMTVGYLLYTSAAKGDDALVCFCAWCTEFLVGIHINAMNLNNILDRQRNPPKAGFTSTALLRQRPFNGAPATVIQ